MELLFWIDAFKRASAASVTAVIPYFSYAKGDKKDEPRVSIRARVCADAIEAAGVDRVVTLDLHAPQVQGFFKVPVDDLYALPGAVRRDRRQGARPISSSSRPTPASPRRPAQWADRLRGPLAIAEKRRVDHTESAEVVELIGSVEGRTALIVDDFTISAGTLVDAARVVIERGATSVYAAVSHGLLAGPRSSASMPAPSSALHDRQRRDAARHAVRQGRSRLGAGLFGEAIRRIARRESISLLFE